MKRTNKIIVQQSAKFYSIGWRNRNGILHDELKFQQYIANWHNNIKIMMEQENRPDIRKYAKKQELDIGNCDTSYIRYWKISAMWIWKLTKKEKYTGIRRFFAKQLNAIECSFKQIRSCVDNKQCPQAL